MSAGSGPRRLRELLARPEILVLPGAFDPLSARIIEQAGFEAVYATGAGFANAGFGLPDIGFIGLAEVVEHVGRMTEAVDVPVVVDADTGYGELLQVRRTVRELERAGAAAIQLEDQVAPKRCGHFDGQQLIGAEDMVRKLAIALDSRRDNDLVIIARTDARSVEGLDAAIERAQAYAAVGADVIFVEAPRSREELETLPAKVGAPLLANIVEGGKTPVSSADQLQEAGFKIALFANTALRASMAAVRDAMQTLRADGSPERVLPHMVSWEERQETVALTAYRALEDRYAQGDHHDLAEARRNGGADGSAAGSPIAHQGEDHQ
ncbi:MAG TPA: isocitrate lyase/phosphoenolpyruvate mutase family protein [Acidimicrobiales bacterium]|nr:isocitrate lyase/phosphoenolpyruvate mutase family protein [Acidimicrobiales bacterium]